MRTVGCFVRAAAEHSYLATPFNLPPKWPSLFSGSHTFCDSTLQHRNHWLKTQMFLRKGLSAAAAAVWAGSTSAYVIIDRAAATPPPSPSPTPTPSTLEAESLQADTLKVTRLGGAANHDDAASGFSVGAVCTLGSGSRTPLASASNGTSTSTSAENVLVVIGANHRPAAYNSVVHLPGLVTKEECQMLRDAADSRSNELEVHTLFNPDYPVDGKSLIQLSILMHYHHTAEFFRWAL